MERSEFSNVVEGQEFLRPTVREILAHLCAGDERCRAFGFVVEWCESRHDCAYAVMCPGCGLQFLVSDEDLDELRAWTDAEGNRLVCGVNWE
jgi:hypothetical protein